MADTWGGSQPDRNPQDRVSGDTYADDRQARQQRQGDSFWDAYVEPAVDFIADIIDAATLGLSQPITGAVRQSVDAIGTALGVGVATQRTIGEAFRQGIDNNADRLGRMRDSIGSKQALHGALTGGLATLNPLGAVAGAVIGASDKAHVDQKYDKQVAAAQTPQEKQKVEKDNYMFSGNWKDTAKRGGLTWAAARANQGAIDKAKQQDTKAAQFRM